MRRWRGQRERIYLARVEPFEPVPRLDLVAEQVTELRWWTAGEIAASHEVFSPRRLATLLHELLAHGPLDEPIDVGV